MGIPRTMWTWLGRLVLLLASVLALAACAPATTPTPMTLPREAPAVTPSTTENDAPAPTATAISGVALQPGQAAFLNSYADW
ncbi:MAG: hypothetical protein AAF125_13860 [Chloroflexota bacterium]